VTATLIALVLPLGLDTLAAALVLGAAGLTADRRLRLSLVFACFEGGMPLIGLAIGAPLGHAIGRIAGYAGAGLVIALGAWVLVGGDGEERERNRLLSLGEGGLSGALALGIGISLDELAIGFSAGLLRLPIVALAVAVAAQAFVVTQLGARLSARASAAAPALIEKLAGVALVALGIAVLIERAGA
jgi:putative Mn2+ efflux pump MntP